MADIKKEQERDELHRAIWSIADDLRGSVDGWDFKSYVLGTMFYRFISENLTSYINKGEWEAGNPDFNYADNLEEETNDAIALFGDKEASGMVLLKSYKDYYYGYDENGKHQKGYEERIAELLQKYPLGTDIIGEKAEKDFIVLFGNILRLRNILSTFDEFTEEAAILLPIDFQDYTGIYNDLHDKYRRDVDKDNINDDIVFEMELVKQIEVNIDYILMLVAKYHESNCEDKTILASIDRAIKSSLELRSKKELIESFIATITVKTDVDKDWAAFVKEQQKSDIETLIAEERLNSEELRKYLFNAFRDGQIKTSGTDIDKIMPPVSRFGGGARAEKKQIVIDKLKAFFEKYYGLGMVELTS